MGKIILGVTISLDGFAEDMNGSVNALYPDLGSLSDTEYMRDSIKNTGSVVMSKKEFEMAEDPDLYADHYEYQVPIFIFTDNMPSRNPKETDRISFTFVTKGIAEAVRLAKEAAGDKDVNIIGSALTTELCLKERLADELQVDILPIFLGEGFRPFENMGKEDLRLERIEQSALPEGRTHLVYRFSMF
ncbi:dihydrofolate reductase family protein [Proteiniclasticum sp.]|uniref:dihydrofolate reductase family protein n=1 Tax=Proteiniclasticum sp. TaxID=2053595 RepID=UPI00289D0F2A|nr:dihydrofolate reductase family protein [Proteiniclasticum sp.]